MAPRWGGGADGKILRMGGRGREGASNRSIRPCSLLSCPSSLGVDDAAGGGGGGCRGNW